MALFIFETTYVVRAPDKATADEVKEKVEAQLRSDTLVIEHWTKLTDIEDTTSYEEEDEEEEVSP